MSRLPLIAVLFVLLVACTKPQAMPRREAFPRAILLDTVMASAPAPAYFLVNAQADVRQSRADWLTVAYPQYAATMYITFSETSPKDIHNVKKNRMERLMLNSGDLPSQHTEFTNTAGYDILLAYTEGGPIPLQFLATDNSSMVVSGAVQFSNPNASAAVDSITPVMDAIRGDIMCAMLHLKPLAE